MSSYRITSTLRPGASTQLKTCSDQFPISCRTWEHIALRSLHKAKSDWQSLSTASPIEQCQ